MLITFNKILNRIWYRNYLRRRLRSVGRNFRFGYGGNLECPQSYVIGHNFFSGPYGYFSTNKDTVVVIGDDVMFGPYCKIIGGNHNINWSGGRMMNAPYMGAGKGIVIEDDVWVGAGATILDGAYISEGCVIAAGAVLVSKTRPYSVYGGVPARFIRHRFPVKEISSVCNSRYSAADLQAMYDD
jgi:acetyltransferase-like isoleucine patch superfamily enzyme